MKLNIKLKDLEMAHHEVVPSLKIDGSFPFDARPVFKGKMAVSFREGKCHIVTSHHISHLTTWDV